MLWAICAFVGIIMAPVYFGIHKGIAKLESEKLKFLSDLAFGNSENPFSADKLAKVWGYSSLYTVGLALLAAGCCVYNPAAGGSGIPETLAYLNGSYLKGAMSMPTFILKVVSMILAVGSGLACGPEGPTIHAGAVLAVALAELMSRNDTLNTWMSGVESFKRRFGSDEDRNVIINKRRNSMNNEEQRYDIQITDYGIDSDLKVFCCCW